MTHQLEALTGWRQWRGEVCVWVPVGRESVEVVTRVGAPVVPLEKLLLEPLELPATPGSVCLK